jgi:TnpA family transposase
MRFAPRIRDLADQRLYRLDSIDLRRYPRLRGRIAGVLRKDKVLKQWDELLRVAGSLKLGWVTASLLVEKLQRLSESNTLVADLQRYGQLAKTLHVLEWYADEAFRRRISTMLNKGEALHSLRSTVRHANKGVFRRGHDEALANEAGCLNLVVNAIITWNTVYMAEALRLLRAEGHPIRDEDLPHIWPTRHEHMNVHGKLRFNVEEQRTRRGLRPLARPKAAPGLPPIP